MSLIYFNFLQESHEPTAVASITAIANLIASVQDISGPIKAFFKDSLADLKPKPALRAATLFSLATLLQNCTVYAGIHLVVY